jgi:hypothetical protein
MTSIVWTLFSKCLPIRFCHPLNSHCWGCTPIVTIQSCFALLWVQFGGDSVRLHSFHSPFSHNKHSNVALFDMESSSHQHLVFLCHVEKKQEITLLESGLLLSMVQLCRKPDLSTRMELPMWKLLPDTHQSQMKLHLDKLDTPLTDLEAPNKCSLVEEEGGWVAALSYSSYSWHHHHPPTCPPDTTQNLTNSFYSDCSSLHNWIFQPWFSKWANLSSISTDQESSWISPDFRKITNLCMLAEHPSCA